jgi:RNA 2',3'-cyclic 3'-phosphodiesterase
MRIRTFFALECEEGVQKMIDESTQSLRERAPSFRWVRRENLHLTVRFLGNIEQAKIPAIESAVREPFSSFPSFKLSFAGIGGFPSREECRVVWLGVRGGYEACCQVKALVDHHLVSCGFPKEPRMFIPHLTLGRVKTTEDSSSAAIPEESPITETETVVNGLSLFKSVLEPAGPVYTRLFKVHFKDVS